MARFGETAAESTPLPANVHVSAHPLVKSKLSALRLSRPSNSTDDAGATGLMANLSSPADGVKALVRAIGSIVASDALAAELETVEAEEAKTPLGYPFIPTVIADEIAVVPILRSGLGMVTALEELLHPKPFAVHHLGMYRDSASGRPVEYYNNFTRRPDGVAAPVAILVDPVIATGQTMAAAIESVVEWGAKKVIVVTVLASDFGVRKVATKPYGPDVDVQVWVGGIDNHTDADGMLKPGLGDIGDRMFGAVGK